QGVRGLRTGGGVEQLRQRPDRGDVRGDEAKSAELRLLQQVLLEPAGGAGAGEDHRRGVHAQLVRRGVVLRQEGGGGAQSGAVPAEEEATGSGFQVGLRGREGRAGHGTADPTVRGAWPAVRTRTYLRVLESYRLRAMETKVGAGWSG